MTITRALTAMLSLQGLMQQSVTAVLSPLIHARRSLGAAIEEYIWKGKSDGRSWLEVKEAFGL